MGWTVGALLTGKSRPIADGQSSAIAKAPRDGPVAIGPLGLEGDEQADKVNHGGPDMAVHYFPFDHYPVFRERFGNPAPLSHPGGFGENISATSLVETEAFIGDRYRLGTALLEISQARQPCRTLELYWQRRGVVKFIAKTLHCGWYFRVLEAGSAQSGDTLELVERGPGGWSVATVFEALCVGSAPPAALRDLAALDRLSPGWRKRAAEAASRPT